jgi:hypothetical protein
LSRATFIARDLEAARIEAKRLQLQAVDGVPLETQTCFSGFDPSLMAQGSQAIRESSSVLGEGNSLGR